MMVQRGMSELQASFAIGMGIPTGRGIMGADFAVSERREAGDD